MIANKMAHVNKEIDEYQAGILFSPSRSNNREIPKSLPYPKKHLKKFMSKFTELKHRIMTIR